MNLKRIVTRVLQHVWFIGEQPLIYKGVPVGTDNKVSFLGTKFDAGMAVFYRSILLAVTPSGVLNIVSKSFGDNLLGRAAGVLFHPAYIIGMAYLLLICILCARQKSICKFVDKDRTAVILAREKFINMHPDWAELALDVVLVDGFDGQYYKYTCRPRTFINKKNK